MATDERITQPWILGTREAIPPEPRTGPPQRPVPTPGAKLSRAELAAELLRQGFSPADLKALEARRLTTYEGHRRCIKCGAFHHNRGAILDRCPSCGWCRHAATTSGVCVDCGEVDPKIPELGPEHHDIHWLDATGNVEQTERR